jgi:hypothetical protein
MWSSHLRLLARPWSCGMNHSDIDPGVAISVGFLADPVLGRVGPEPHIRKTLRAWEGPHPDISISATLIGPGLKPFTYRNSGHPGSHASVFARRGSQVSVGVEGSGYGIAQSLQVPRYSREALCCAIRFNSSA